MFFKGFITLCTALAALGGRPAFLLLLASYCSLNFAQDADPRAGENSALDSAPQQMGASFELKPARCVALHEGQACYAKLRFNWQLAQPRAVCIKLSDSAQSMNCWPVAQQGIWQVEFESERSREFLLVERDSEIVLGRASFTVAWVYDAKSRRQSHWRIF
jgi:hypothetical protein